MAGQRVDHHLGAVADHFVARVKAEALAVGAFELASMWARRKRRAMSLPVVASVARHGDQEVVVHVEADLGMEQAVETVAPVSSIVACAYF